MAVNQNAIAKKVARGLLGQLKADSRQQRRILFRVGSVIMRKKRDELRAARGRTRDRIRFEVVPPRTVLIHQRSKALIVRRKINRGEERLYLIGFKPDDIRAIKDAISGLITGNKSQGRRK